MTKQNVHGDTPLVRYLLGRADPEEQERIEQRYLADPDFHQELQATERDLIDQYVHGELPHPEEFERHFFASPERRQRVEFARALRQSLAARPALDRGALSDHRPAATFHEWLGGFIAVHRWHIAAASVVLFVAGWLFVSRQPLETMAPIATQPPGEVGREPAPPVPVPPAAEPPAPESPSRAVATFVLLPSLTRDAGETPILRAMPDVDVRLRLVLDASEYETYRVAVRTADGDDIWRQDGVRASRSSDGDILAVTVPAQHLTDQDYIVKVSGRSGTGEVEEAASYYFRVQRK